MNYNLHNVQRYDSKRKDIPGYIIGENDFNNKLRRWNCGRFIIKTEITVRQGSLGYQEERNF